MRIGRRVWIIAVELGCVATWGCKATKTPTGGADAGDAARFHDTRVQADASKHELRNNTLSFSFNGKRVDAHRIQYKRDGKREVIVGACTIDGDPYVVELTHGFTWSASIPLMILINTRSKSVLKARGAKPEPFHVALAVAGEGRVAGYFAGGLMDRDGRVRGVTNGRYDVARANEPEIRATAAFSMNGVRVEGFSSRFMPVGGRFLFQALGTPRPGETFTLVMQLPSLEPGVYAFPGSEIDVRVMHHRKGDGGRAGRDVFLLRPPTGATAKSSAMGGGYFKVSVEGAQNGKQATFGGELLSPDGSRKAVVEGGLMRFEPL
ncbi:MAG: hypothetical protein HYY84_10825 [Deltaproteobacteria bacterium]|nr:hypothetical protein [Deltaproteobacteria bacterium]